MQVVNDYPPNFDEIDAVFHTRGKPVLYAFGDRIYAPGGQAVSPALMAHEGVHGRRQGPDVLGWWRRYIDDVQFRLAEEIEAHAAEYAYLLGHSSGRNDRRRHLAVTAARMAAPLYRYGSLLTSARARDILKYSYEARPSYAMAM